MSSDVRKVLDPVTPYSRTLKQYSIDDKLLIISYAKNHGNRAAGREFNVAESSIREWRKNENKLIHNRNVAAAGLSAQSSSTSSAPGSIHSNNNNNHHHCQNQQNQNQNYQSVFPTRSPENIAKHLQIAQITQFAMMNIAIQWQNLQNSASTSSSVAGTPSSTSSSSPPPPSTSPALPVSGSGRRKPRCPMKIVVSSDDHELTDQE